jgi:N-acetyl-anhydromuramyl-L-alanine amidase AmpD
MIRTNYLSLNKKARSGILFQKKVDLIMVHWIGPYPNQTPNIVRNWWENGSDKTGVQASAHFVVKDNDVLQTLPMNKVGWHSGDSRNYHSIGIEVIPMNAQGEFSEASMETLAKLVKDIRIEYPDTKIVRHFDGTQKKDCPRWYTPLEFDGDKRWTELVRRINRLTRGV